MSLDTISDYLDLYYFQKIWNSIKNENRANIIVKRLIEPVQTNIIRLRYANIKLPEEGAFCIYSVPITLITQFVNLKTSKWINASELLQHTSINMFLYDPSGRTLPSKGIWLYRSKSTRLLIAIRKDVMVSSTTTGYKSTLFLTLYTDVNRHTPLQIYSELITSDNVDATNKYLSDVISTYSKSDMIFINGWSYEKNVPTLVPGDTFEHRRDLDINIQYNSDVDNNQNGYYSDMYEGNREIIHTPKSENPDNIVYTHNSISFFVRDDSGKGVYYHRVKPRTVRNITHNDYSLDRTVIEDFKNSLSASQVHIDVRIRQGLYPTSLQHDIHEIKEMYNDTDENIILHLHGWKDRSLDFWKASEVEKSAYIDMMFNMKFTENDHILQYIKGLGYYEVMSTLSKNTITAYYPGGDFFLYKPYILMNKNVDVLIFHKGKKIPRDQYGLINETYHVQIYFRVPLVESLQNELLTYWVVENNTNYRRVMSPTLTDNVFKIDDKDGYLYELNDYKTPVTTYQQCYGNVYTRGFNPKNRSLYNIYEDNSVPYIQFNSLQCNRNYMTIAHNNAQALYFDIQSLIVAEKAIILSLSTLVSLNGIEVQAPLMATYTSKVFLNNNWLVEGVDYVINILYDDDGLVLDQQLLLTNKNFLNLDEKLSLGNRVEVYVSSDQTLGVEVGYSDNGFLKKSNLPCVLYEKISFLFVEGSLKTDFFSSSAYFRLPESSSTGEVFNSFIVHNTSIKDQLSQYNEYMDIENRRQLLIKQYYRRTFPETPNIRLISDQHEVYSPFFMRLIDDVRNSKFQLVDEPNNVLFLKQFSPYQHILDNDPTLHRNNNIDRSLVAVSASYAHLSGMSPDDTRIIKRLIDLILITQEHTVGENYGR